MIGYRVAVDREREGEQDRERARERVLLQNKGVSLLSCHSYALVAVLQRSKVLLDYYTLVL